PALRRVRAPLRRRRLLRRAPGPDRRRNEGRAQRGRAGDRGDPDRSERVPRAGHPGAQALTEDRRQGALFLATVVVAWGLTWPVNKVVLASVPPIWAVTLRSLVATLALFALAALLGRGRLTIPPREDMP